VSLDANVAQLSVGKPPESSPSMIRTKEQKRILLSVPHMGGREEELCMTLRLELAVYRRSEY